MFFLILQIYCYFHFYLYVRIEELHFHTVKDALASQPTVSRFFNRMDEDTLNQFLAITRVLRMRIYSIQMPQAVILDLDSTLLDAYGRQEGRAFNFHYQSNSYHPLVCYDGSIPKLVLNNYSLKILYTYFSLKSFQRVLTNILSCSSPSC